MAYGTNDALVKKRTMISKLRAEAHLIVLIFFQNRSTIVLILLLIYANVLRKTIVRKINLNVLLIAINELFARKKDFI